MNKKTEQRNPFKSLGVGYAHYLRNGAGAHKDRKKESNKKQCRIKMKASDWKSSFLEFFKAGKMSIPHIFNSLPSETLANACLEQSTCGCRLLVMLSPT